MRRVFQPFKVAFALILLLLAMISAVTGIGRFSHYQNPNNMDRSCPKTLISPQVLGGQIGFCFVKRSAWIDWKPSSATDCPIPSPVQPIDVDGSYVYVPPQGRPLSSTIPWHRYVVFVDWGVFHVYAGLVPSTRCPPHEPTRTFTSVGFTIRVHGLLIALVLTTWPAMFFWRMRRAATRRRRGLCVKCGYNLADNTTGICPECGNKLALLPATSSSCKMKP